MHKRTLREKNPNMLYRRTLLAVWLAFVWPRAVACLTAAKNMGSFAVASVCVVLQRAAGGTPHAYACPPRQQAAGPHKCTVIASVGEQLCVPATSERMMVTCSPLRG